MIKDKIFLNQSAESAALETDLSAADSAKIFLGVDGGGTKTLAVLIDETGAALSEAATSASNPLRVGVENAVNEITAAVDRACDAIGKRRSDIVAAQIGLAGVRREDLRLRIANNLSRKLGIELLNVVTDAEIALYGAVNGAPGLVIIAGTGSICCGRNAAGETATAGGWGPLAGDEGGGAGIARRALQSIAKASDGRAAQTVLSDRALDYFRAASVQDLSTAIYAPGTTNDKIAGFARFVVEAARNNDEVSIQLLEEAACELALMAKAVIARLNLQNQAFQVAYVGGIFQAKELIFNTLIKKIRQTAATAFLAAPQFAPHIAAAKMAIALCDKNTGETAFTPTANLPRAALKLNRATKNRAPSNKRLRP